MGNFFSTFLDRFNEKIKTTFFNENSNLAKTPIRFCTDLDPDRNEKIKKILDQNKEFGSYDFADLAGWLFTSSLSDHLVIHQRLDEGTCLWRAVKSSRGPILEIGRAAGGSTILILGASENRHVTSIDRAPTHDWTSNLIFEREDVKRRVKFYVQSSRENIDDQEFGLIFIDGDHSYEGICHDIGLFWNQLKSFDGCAPLAVFHDGAENPITYVDPVYQACLELLSKPGVARKVDSWGSMLVLEKVGNIDQSEWFRKEHKGFWDQFATGDISVYVPEKLRTHINILTQEKIAFSENILSNASLEGSEWKIEGMCFEPLPLTADSPISLLKEQNQNSEHGIKLQFSVQGKIFNFTFFVRPLGTKSVEVSFTTTDVNILCAVKIDLFKNEVVSHDIISKYCTLPEIEIDYRCGYYRITTIVSHFLPIGSEILTLSVKSLDYSHNSFYTGDPRKGLFTNLMSLRFAS